MLTADEVFRRTKAWIADILKRDAQKCGAMCKAVKAFADRHGVSPMWVRRIRGEYGQVTIQGHHYLNIRNEHRKRFSLKAGAARVMRIVKRKVVRPSHSAAAAEATMEV